MAQDSDFTNGQYVVIFDPEQPEILLAVNSALRETRRVAGNIRRLTADKKLKQVGRVAIGEGNSTTPHFNLEYSNLTEDRIIHPIMALVSAFEREGEYAVRRTLDNSYHAAESDGHLASQQDLFDFYYEGGLKKLIRNLVVEGRIHVIKYAGEVERPTGANLDQSHVSDRFREDTDLDFATQLYGFIEDVHFESFRTEPGMNRGWDCDVTGAARWGVKYHRISKSDPSDYSFENDIGSFKCALGILRDAKGVKLLSIEETLQRFGR